MVEGTVQKRVNGILDREKKVTAQQNLKTAQIEKAQDFMKRTGMSEDEFGTMLKSAKSREFTFDDMYYILNRDKVAQNVASSTKNEMLGQMKQARDIPTSQGGTNSAPASTKSADDSIFDTLSDSDGGLSDLFD